MSLIAILLTLHAETDATVPRDLGRAVYAAVLENLNRVAPGLAAQIHSGDGPRPLTCSGILNGDGNYNGMQVKAGQPYYVRVTGLTGEVSAALAATLVVDPPACIELDRHRFILAAAVCDGEQSPWAGRTSYEALAAAQMLSDGAPPRQVTLSFASPVAFKSGGMQMPLPLPGLVFGSLVDRWNSFSPVRLSPDLRRFGEEAMAISRYRLHSRPVAQKGGAVRIGGVGRITYTALRQDRYWQGVMALLADFALYSGVGVQTTTGMGQTRRVV